MQYRRITKAAAIKRFSADQPFYVCPCKMSPSGAWNVAYLCLGAAHIEDTRWLNPSATNRECWNRMYNNWAYYNTSAECGQYAHYYVEVLGA